MPQQDAHFSIGDHPLDTLPGSRFFTIADYTRVDPEAPSASTAIFAAADYLIQVEPGLLLPDASFTVAEYVIIDPDTPGAASVVFSVADHPVSSLPVIIKPSASFVVSEYTLSDSDYQLAPTDAVFAIAELVLMGPPAVVTPIHAFFSIADVNIITDPSPEKLKVWDTVKQQWVHAPRYIWHDDLGEWRQLS